MTKEPYVGVSDVIPWVDANDYQTSQATESHQLRGARPCRRGREPAYVVRGGTPSAVVPSSESMGCVEYVGDVSFQRFDEAELARLQAFPEHFKWVIETKTQTREIIGNAVPPCLARHVVGELL